MAVQTQHYTVEEFDRFAALPENAERRLELIGGEVIEVVANSYSSIVTLLLSAEIVLYVKKHKLGYVTGESSGYIVGDERYIPDAGFISKAKQPTPPHKTWIPFPPDLAAEVLSPTDEPADVRFKVFNYLKAGTIVWVVDPDKKQVEIYTPGGEARRIGIDGTLDGGEVLPGFTLPVKEIFPE